MTLDLGTVIARRFELADQIEKEALEFKNKQAPLHEELALCETFVKDEMNKAGLQNVKTTAGMPYFTTKDKVKVTDWTAALAFMKEHNLFHLITRAFSKDAVKEYMKENNGALPPGAGYESYRDLNWTRR